MEERYGSAGLASEITTCRFWSVLLGVVVRWEAMKFQCEAGITKVKHGAQVLPYWAYVSIVYTYMDPLSNPPLGGVVLSDIYFEPWGSCYIWEVLRWNAGTPYMEQCGYADSEVHFGHIDPKFNVKSRAAQNRYQRNIPFAMRDAALNLFFFISHFRWQSPKRQSIFCRHQMVAKCQGVEGQSQSPMFFGLLQPYSIWVPTSCLPTYSHISANRRWIDFPAMWWKCLPKHVWGMWTAARIKCFFHSIVYKNYFTISLKYRRHLKCKLSWKPSWDP